MVIRVRVCAMSLWFVGVVASAQSTSWEYSADSGDTLPWTTSATAACAALAQKATNATFSVTSNGPVNLIEGRYRNCSLRYVDASTGEVVTATSIQGLSSRVSEAPPGGGTSDACVGTMGKDKTFVRNWTVGYSRSPDESDEKFVGPVNRLPGAGNPVCMGGCKVLQQDTSAPGWKAWISQSPTDQGLFRNSLDVPFTSTGETCTEGTGATAPISPDVPAPPCPGYVGEVNGKPGCYGTAAKPIDPVSKSLPPVPKDAGNPPAGSGPEAPNTGQSRTPSAGGGGPSGGPAGAAVGGKGGKEGGTPSLGGSGTTPKPGEGEEQQACGAPGQPACRIDGSDVPKDAGSAVDAAKTASEKNAADTKAAIDRAASMEAPGWSFSFQLPTGCTAYTPAAFGDFGISINPCEWQGTIHDLMSMIWAAATAFCIIGMVGRTIREA